MPRESKAPCSIVVTNYNGRDLLKECLASVVLAVSRHNPRDEIIVVDDNSGDGSCKLVSEHFPSVKLAANRVNVGFQRASNIGAFIAKFPIIVFLNNDVVVEPDSISVLCSYFDRYEDLFAASAKLYGWDRLSFLAGRRVAVFEEGHFRLKDLGQDEDSPRLTLFATGGAAAFDREKFLELGGFDSVYSPLYWEDIDVCYRALKRGWPVVYAPDAVMYHKHRATIATTTAKKRLRLITARNSYIFLYKNILAGEMLRQHLLWSLYFFTRDAMRADFRFQRAFLMALLKLLRVLKSRARERRAHLMDDREIIRRIQNGDPRDLGR